MMTSWSGADNAMFWNNDTNSVFYTDSDDGIDAANVSDNVVGSSWTAAAVTAPVPLPGALPLMLAAAGALFAIRRRTTTA
jgi:hypothetical protein